jgi:DNA-binding protein YbaB
VIPERPGPATPEMNAALRTRFEELLGEYDRVRANFAAMQQRLREVKGEAQSKDGSVRLTVGPQGNLLSLQLEPRAYRRLSPSELAGEILELSGQAGRDARGQLEQVMAPFLPTGVSYTDVMDGQADPATWAPKQPLSDDTFDAWWSGIGRPPAPDQPAPE